MTSDGEQRAVRRVTRTKRSRTGRGREARGREVDAGAASRSPARAVPQQGTIDVAWDGVRARLSRARVQEIVRTALHHGGRPGIDASIVFVTDRALARIHGAWLDDPTRTDVISFDLSDGVSQACELYVSVECAQREARARGIPLARELTLYLVHGALHVCGYDDHDPRDVRAMHAAERRVLTALGWPGDPRA